MESNDILKESNGQAPKRYQFFRRKVYKGKCAPQGWLFLIVRVKAKRGTFEAFILANVVGASEADFNHVAESLYTQIENKYLK